MFLGSSRSYFLDYVKRGVWSSACNINNRWSALILRMHISGCLCRYAHICIVPGAHARRRVASWQLYLRALKYGHWEHLHMAKRRRETGRECHQTKRNNEMFLDWHFWFSSFEVWKRSPVRKDIPRGHIKEWEVHWPLPPGTSWCAPLSLQSICVHECLHLSGE